MHALNICFWYKRPHMRSVVPQRAMYNLSAFEINFISTTMAHVVGMFKENKWF